MVATTPKARINIRCIFLPKGSQKERYRRHLVIPEVGEEGQAKLLRSKVLLMGAGGLGSPAALYLAAAQGKPGLPRFLSGLGRVLDRKLVARTPAGDVAADGSDDPALERTGGFQRPRHGHPV